MGSCSRQIKSVFFIINTIDKKPIGFDMAFPKTFIISDEFVGSAAGREVLILS